MTYACVLPLRNESPITDRLGSPDHFPSPTPASFPWTGLSRVWVFTYGPVLSGCWVVAAHLLDPGECGTPGWHGCSVMPGKKAAGDKQKRNGSRGAGGTLRRLHELPRDTGTRCCVRSVMANGSCYGFLTFGESRSPAQSRGPS